MPPKKHVKAKDTFETALSRLETIVTALEDGDVPLEESLKKFEEGMALAKFCGTKLDDIEKKVTALITNARGEVQEVPFETSSD